MKSRGFRVVAEGNHNLRKDWSQAVEHVVIAKRITKLPLLDRPGDDGREKQRLVHLGCGGLGFRVWRG